MRIPSPTRIATLSLLVGGLACAKNSANEDVGAARDTTTLDSWRRYDKARHDSASTTVRDTAGVPDSLKPNQSKSGVTDTKTGESTIPDVTQTRPDQGQPVTSKGDTLTTPTRHRQLGHQPGSQVLDDQADRRRQLDERRGRGQLSGG